MRSSRRWLWALPLAWAGAVAIVLAPRTDILALAVCLCWFGFAASLLSRGGRQRAVAFLLALAVPLQGFAAVRLQAQGPAHFHGSSSHTHSHANIQRHFHAAATEAIEVEDEHDRALKQAAQGKSSPFGPIDAASISAPFVAPPGTASRVSLPAPGPFTEHHPNFPDRPPRFIG